MSHNKNKSNFLDRDVLLKFFEENPNHGILYILSYLINGLLLSEREIFLSESRDIPNKANGFSSRNIFTPLGKFHIDVPRDRKSLFYSDLLPPPYHRTYPDDYFHLLLLLINNSYSPNGIKNVLHLLNLPYSPESIDKIKDDLFKKATELNESPIKEDMFAIFIDAYHCKMRDDFSQGTSGKIKESVIYVVIGIDLDGNKDLIG